MTPDQMAACAAQGQFWWMRPDGSFYGTKVQEPGTEGDHYLLNATPEWCAQWESWEQAAEVMAPLFARLEDLQ